MLKVAIVLHGAPYESQGFHTALRLGRALMASRHHRLHTLALFGGATLLAVGADAAGHAATLRSHWLQLAESSGCALRVCPSALARRGFPVHALAPPLELAGMVETLALLAAADRVVEFH